MKIKNIIFDLGGVILTLDHAQAVSRFEELGLKDAASRLDAYTQTGIFGALEMGEISAGVSQGTELAGGQGVDLRSMRVCLDGLLC